MGAALKKNETIDLAVKATQEDVMSNMTSKLRAAAKSTADHSASRSVRNVILSHVTEERYEMALEALDDYAKSRPEYPEFHARAEKYVRYAAELIHAIQVKRSFPGWNVLNISKQKDLFETALRHFEDFKVTLAKIETIEREVKIDDVKSTVWVMRACVYSVCALLAFAVAKEVTGGLIPAANMLIDMSTNQLVDFIFDKLKL